jgi:bifunctional non-homologous end joining protein LigD
MKKAVRTNKVLVDWSQNDEHKTTISVYSLRARERPTVSTPVSWREVEQALKQKNAGGLVFESNEVLARVEKMGDLFAPVQKLKQKLPQLAGLDGGSGGNGEQEGDADQEEAGVSLAAEGQTGRRANPKKRATTKGDSASEKRRKL